MIRIKDHLYTCCNNLGQLQLMDGSLLISLSICVPAPWYIVCTSHCAAIILSFSLCALDVLLNIIVTLYFNRHTPTDDSPPCRYNLIPTHGTDGWLNSLYMLSGPLIYCMSHSAAFHSSSSPWPFRIPLLLPQSTVILSSRGSRVSLCVHWDIIINVIDEAFLLAISYYWGFAVPIDPHPVQQEPTGSN